MVANSSKKNNRSAKLTEIELQEGGLALIFTCANANHEIATWRKKYSLLIYRPDFSQKNVESVSRMIVKKKWCDAILDVDLMPKKNSNIQYLSLLDTALVKECAKSNVSVLVSLESIQDKNAHESYLMRVLQSRMLCKKYGVKHQVIDLASFSINNSDLSALTHLL